MDPRIADYIRENRRRYTREAMRQQLIDAGHDPAEIDATWAALDTPDADDTAGEGFWGRFALIVIGLNLAVFVIVVLATGMLSSPVVAVVLGVVLAIGALIAWAIVAATGPAQMGRTTAMVVGTAVPLLFALLIGGSCYALVGAIGPQGPPPRNGVVELEIDPPIGFSGSGAASCQPYADGTGFGVYTQEGSLGTIDGRPLYASIDSFPTAVEPGVPAPAPAPGAKGGQNLSLLISLIPRSETDEPREWFVSPATELDIDAAPDGLSGTVRFEGLEGAVFEEPAQPGGGEGSISGTISWACD